MSSSRNASNNRTRNASGVSRFLAPEHAVSSAASSEAGDAPDELSQRHSEASPSRFSFSSSANQRAPARSFYHRSFYDSRTPVDIAQHTSQGVREDTAELASIALSEIVSSRSGQSPVQHEGGSSGQSETGNLAFDRLSYRTSNESSRPDVIREVSEPSSVHSRPSSRPGRSALTALIRNSPPSDTAETDSEEDSLDGAGIHPVTVQEGIISQPHEETTLLLKRAVSSTTRVTPYGTVGDLEGQKPLSTMSKTAVKLKDTLRKWKARFERPIRTVGNPKSWDLHTVWVQVIRKPASYIPSVILGLLLNILDALSYGMILFPLGEPIFADLGPDGISIYYVSCIVAQLVYSLGGSIFRGGIGSEMIEVVPFFHKMAFTILNRIGKDNPHAVRATVILSYSLSSILTGVVFFLMGKCKLGALIGFFPRHILIGCIGGVGWFLVSTGFEVSARLEGSLSYDVSTLQLLLRPETVPLWVIPLALAINLLVIKHWVKNPLTDATFFLSIIAIFYYFVFAIPELDLDALRSRGWVFEAPPADVPFYHFYSLFDFKAIDWPALGSTVPAMLALTFFGVLHVPINVPALGVTTGEDNVDVDRELRAHGISNALSGLCGSIQNYLVYTNTVLFIRSGGDSRLAGVMLALGTFGILISGPIIIGYIPIMVVGSLIFFLGIDLLREALVDTWGKVHRLEYFTIFVIIVTMGAVDFVIGILVGILLACVSFVLQTSQVSAIRGTLYGGVANSTVRRHPIQHRFLRDAGEQIHVMKLAGYLFFGTIVGVEKDIRTLLDKTFQEKPIRFLVLDLYNVDGVDYSAAEAFTRISRILGAKHVQMVICGLTMEGEVRKSLSNVGLFDAEDGVQYFVSLNSALEHCENELLKTFYRDREVKGGTGRAPAFLEVPKHEQEVVALPNEAIYSSPRRQYLQQVATTTLNVPDSGPPSKWHDYTQPLQLILQTFSTVSDKPEDFWYPTQSYFREETFATGSVLYRQGDPSTGFYLLERGILKAEYNFPQGSYSELIVAGTTCGELPFFSSTQRTATIHTERDCVTWVLDRGKWQEMQEVEPRIAQELLTISLKFTSERMDAITKYMLLTSG